MRRSVLILACCLAGCVSPRAERIADYNADGVFLYQQGAYGPARDSFQAALALKVDDVGLLYNLGECEFRRGKHAEAERCFTQCLQREPNHVPCRFALAELYLQTGRPSEVRRMIDDWFAREPKRADVYALDGWFRHVSGDLPAAQGRLQQALELEPHNRRALLELGLLYEAMQRPERAVALYERVLMENPDQPEVRQRLQELRTRGAGTPEPD